MTSGMNQPDNIKDSDLRVKQFIKQGKKLIVISKNKIYNHDKVDLEIKIIGKRV